MSKPHIRWMVFVWMFVTLAAARGTSANSRGESPTPPPPVEAQGLTHKVTVPTGVGDADAFEQHVVELVNQARWDNGQLPPLKRVSALDGAARVHSTNMGVRNFFAHCDLDTGKTPSQRAVDAGYGSTYVGENAAAGYSTPDSVMTGWMNSPGHRQNILGTSYRDIGLGYYYDVGDAGNVRYDEGACKADDGGHGPFFSYWTMDLGTRWDVYPVVINREAYSTTTHAVSLYVYGSGWATQMQFSNDGISWSGWEPYGVFKSWSLSPGNGVKTVYTQIKNSSNAAQINTDTIVLAEPVPSLQVAPSLVHVFAQIGDTTTTPASTVLNVTNSGAGTMAWTASASPDWVNITPTVASAPGPLTVTFGDVSAMTTGAVTYDATIIVSATTPGTTNTPQVIPVSLTVITTVSKLVLPIVARNYPLVVTPDDPGFSAQWGLAQVQAQTAWGLSTGNPNVTVAIVDSGVDTSHPDLVGKLVPGHNFANGSNDTDYLDDCGHGTHVAGIAAAATNNGIGVAGLGWNTKILPVKVLGQMGGSCTGDEAGVIDGINWAVGQGAQVINLSLAGPSYDAVLDQATTNAYESGVLVVAAAGNCGDLSYSANGCDSQNQVVYPAGNAHVLAVAATTQSDTRASFSSVNATVDIAAPGDQIFSTWPGTYQYESGTSMATPFVSGLASLVYAHFPSYTATQVAQAIVANADLVGGQMGWSQEFGCGRLNAYRTLASGASGSCVGWGGLSVASLKAPAASRQPDPGQGMVAGRDYVPGQVLVTLREGVGQLQAQAMAVRYGFAMSDLVPRWRIYRLRVPVGQEQATLDVLRADPAVEVASLNGIVRPQ